MTSVVTVFCTMQLYVGLPVLVVGVLDRDTSIDNCLLFPALYLDGPRRQYINRRQFVYVEIWEGLVRLGIGIAAPLARDDLGSLSSASLHRSRRYWVFSAFIESLALYFVLAACLTHAGPDGMCSQSSHSCLRFWPRAIVVTRRLNVLVVPRWHFQRLGCRCSTSVCSHSPQLSSLLVFG
jgi:hypothetical protein